MKHVLENEYEKLKSQDGAFELIRAESFGTSGPLKLILMPNDGYSTPYVRDLVGSNPGGGRGVPYGTDGDALRKF